MYACWCCRCAALDWGDYILILDTTLKKIQIVLSGAVTTNELPIVVSYQDYTSAGITPGCSNAVTNGATPVDIVAAPGGASIYRIVKGISIYNMDTTAKTLTVSYINDATTRILIKVTLQTGESLQYTESNKWLTFGKFGSIKNGSPLILMSNTETISNDAIAINTATASTAGLMKYHFCGFAPKDCSSVNVVYSVSTQAATITYCECCIMRGPVDPISKNAAVSSQNLQVLGWTDTSAIDNSTGIKNVRINLSIPLAAGDPVWYGQAATASTTPRFIGGGVDNISMGLAGSLASGRPSTMPLIVATLSATVIPVWVAIQYN